jgi:putative PIN family toxin of toxin-antitoxin system
LAILYSNYMHVVIDTCVIVAGLRSPHGASRLWIEKALRQELITLISVPLVLQYEEVLLRPEILSLCGVTRDKAINLVDAFCRLGEAVDLTYAWRPLLRDPGDEMVLETAMLGRADTLLTFNVRDFAGSERVGVRVEQPGLAWGRCFGVKRHG